jgi:hypothetical protein
MTGAPVGSTTVPEMAFCANAEVPISRKAAQIDSNDDFISLMIRIDDKNG